MKIFYDNIIFSLQKAGGISVYWYELIDRLLKSNVDIKFIEQDECDNIFRKDLEISRSKILKENKLPLKLLRYMNLTNKLPQNSIFHSSYYRICRQKHVKNIVTVHDFTYEYFNKGLPKLVHSLQKGYAIKNADGIICVSENTKKDLLKFYSKIDESKIRVIYNGVSGEFYPIENKENEIYDKYKREKYIIFVGDRSEYKNFNIVIDAMADLTDFKLVIIGGKDLSDYEKENLDRLAKNRYEQLKGISTKELNILYNFAHCLIYPSRYEGFGIPVIEAMKSGCPVIAMNKSSIPEVAGDAGLLIDDEDYRNFVKQVNRINNELIRKEIKDRGYHQSKKFSWDDSYLKTVEFYKEINKD